MEKETIVENDVIGEVHCAALNEDLKIIGHCINRLLARDSGLKNKTEALLALQYRIEKAWEVELRNPVLKVHKIIQHGFKESRFLFWNGWIFVVEEGNLVTTYECGNLRNSKFRRKRSKLS